MNFHDYLIGGHKSSDKEFVVGRGDPVQFKVLYANSLKISQWLSQKVGENRPVLLLCDNSVFFITVYLAILKSGNICVPLSPKIEKENLKFIADLTESSMAIVSKKTIFRDYIPEVELWDKADIESKMPSAVEEAVPGTNSFDHNRTAQIIFTSGSTGIPKGVMLSHKNLIANTDSIVQSLDLTEHDRMEVVLPFSYCYGLSLLHTHLRVGGSIVINNHFRFLGNLFDDLVKFKCTGFAGVPSHFQILFHRDDETISEKLVHLRYMTQAGGKLTNSQIARVMNKFPNGRFFIMYGQTEATARLSILDPEMLDTKPGSIGKGIPGVLLRVVNPDGSQVEPGETGEVVAKGDNIMQGYFKDPAMSQETIKDGWLYTGDLGRIDEDGYFYILGRKKDIIKTGGERVSPYEIKEVLMSLSWISDCEIKGVPSDILGETIKARVTLNKDIDHELASKKIILHCRTHLAQHKVPRLIEFCDEGELTNQKGMT